MKTCPRCDTSKDESEFGKHTKAKDGLCCWCKLCKVDYNRDWFSKNRKKYPPRYQERKAAGYFENKRLKSYGITAEQFKWLFESQGRCCALCGRTKSGNGKAWGLDHDHNCCPKYKSCGKCIRGILCHGCNAGLGNLGDNAELLLKAASYLGHPCVKFPEGEHQ